MNNILPIDDKMAALNNDKLIQLLSHDSALIRAKAIPALASRMNINQELKKYIFAAASDITNHKLVFFGFIKISWLTVISILEYGNLEDQKVVKEVVKQWPEQEQLGIINYIKEYKGFSLLFKE